MSERSFFEITEYCLNKKNLSFIFNNNFDGDGSINYKNISETADFSYVSEQMPSHEKTYEKKQSFGGDYIKEKDKLFWMLYIFENSFQAYTMLSKNKYSFEMKIKTELASLIKKNKKKLKQYKIKVCDLESDLLYSKSIDITTFFVILMLKNINLMYYNENLIYQWKEYGNESTFILSHDTKNDIYKNEDKALVDEYFNKLKESRLEVDNLKKPIKAISAYKLGGVKDICQQLNIKTMKNSVKSFTKKELYEKIVQKLSI